MLNSLNVCMHNSQHLKHNIAKNKFLYNLHLHVFVIWVIALNTSDNLHKLNDAITGQLFKLDHIKVSLHLHQLTAFCPLTSTRFTLAPFFFTRYFICPTMLCDIVLAAVNMTSVLPLSSRKSRSTPGCSRMRSAQPSWPFMRAMPRGGI